MSSGLDFILVNGGIANGGVTKASSSLIALDATPQLVAGCTPPPDMLTERRVHMIRWVDGQIIACGGNSLGSGLKDCEFYMKGSPNWTIANYTLDLEKAWFPTVQLDNDRIWIGRKLVK